MTQKDKELLLKDLCVRLSYGVKVYNTTFKEPTIQTLYGKISGDEFLMEETYTSVSIDGDDFGSFNKRHYTGYVEFIKPYLRPMSSMTEEEKEELKSKCIHTETEEDWEGVRCDVWGIQILDKYDTRRWDNPIWPSTINIDAIDWLNAHHFDYRGLIEKGLALEAPNGMYKI